MKRATTLRLMNILGGPINIITMTLAIRPYLYNYILINRRDSTVPPLRTWTT